MNNLSKQEYAAIHLNTTPPAVFVEMYFRNNPGPKHPGTVAETFRDKEHAKPIQMFFNTELGTWSKEGLNVVPKPVVDEVNAHVQVVKKYYAELEEFEIERFADMEVAWRRKIANKIIWP